MLKRDFHIIADTGIHARPATLLVRTASKFSSNIFIEYDDKTANLKSIMGVMSLGIGKNADIVISVNGDDEIDALNAIEETMKDENLIK